MKHTPLVPPDYCDPVGRDGAPAAVDRNHAAAGVPPLPGTGAGGSIALVLQKRLEHVGLGYDAAHDALLPATHLVDQAAKYLADAHDLIRRNADPATIRLKLVNATALGLAALDRHLSHMENHRETP